jgi:hypothetical protein
MKLVLDIGEAFRAYFNRQQMLEMAWVVGGY